MAYVSVERLIIDSFSLFQNAVQSLKLTEQQSVTSLTSPGLARNENVAKPGSVLAETPHGLDVLPNFPSTFPSVKRIPNTRFVVDGFRSAGPWSVAYFLSHFHSDHYTGLTNLWNKGLVFCSEITAHLLRESLQVVDALVVSLPMDTMVLIDGCEVTLVDANHCPGAVQFLFRTRGQGADGEWHRYVHCGDMRYSPAMKSDASLCDFLGADAVFLDTTYCNPKFVFPPQQASIEYVAEKIHRLMRGQDLQGNKVEDVLAGVEGDDTMDGGDGGSDEEDDDESYQKAELGEEEEDAADESNKRRSVPLDDEEDEPLYGGRMKEDGFEALNGMSTLFLISTYVIGKEKILTAVAKRCNCSIYVTEKKLAILKRLDIEDIAVFTTDPAATNVHVVGWSFLGETWPYFRPNFVNMEKAMHDRGYKKVVGFVPTGWTYELKKKSFSVRKKGPFEIHLVPYSEHSNYEELREYVGFLRPKEIIPTVGLEGGGMESKAVATMRKHFRNLVDETASKRNFLKGFKRKPPDNNIANLKDSNNVVAPMAVFGRAARKRTWELDVGFTQECTGPSLLLPEYEHHAKRHAATASIQLEEDKVRVETAMELSEAYLEGEDLGFKPGLCKTMEDDDQKDGGKFKSPNKQQAGQSYSSQVISSRNLVNNQVSPTQPANISSQRGLLGKDSSKRPQGRTQATTKKPSTTKRTKKSSTNSLSFKKGNTQSPTVGGGLFSKSQKVMQSSILNFFRKTGEDMNPSQSQSVDYVEEAVAFPGTISNLKDCPKPLLNGGDKLSNSDSTQLQVDMNKWADEYEQLASVLDVNLSRQQANVLLEKAGGDVGIALDLFYKDPHVGQASGSAIIVVESQDASLQSRLVDQGEITMSNGKSTGIKVGDLDRESFVQDEVSKSNTSQVQMHLAKWAEEYKQLSLILDGNVSKEEVHALLEKAGGDITVALDLFYTEKSTGEGRFCSESLLKSGEPTCQVIESPLEKEQMKSSKGEKDPSKVPSVDSPLPSLSSKSFDGSSVKSAVDNKISSVAVPVGKYTPLEHACWQVGEPAPYLHLARAFDLIEQESGRLRTADMLCNMFRSLLALSPEAVLPAVYLTTNRIAPDFESGELSIGGSLVTTAITEATGTSKGKLREMYTSMGDLGDVAQACRQTQSSLRLPPPLGICQVFSTLKQISKEAGNGSGARKKDLVLCLLRACREKEMKYIVRTLIQNMRIGAMMKTVLSALAQAVVLHHTFSAGQAPDKALAKFKPKFQEASAAVIEAYNFLPNLDLLVPTLIKDGVEALSANFTITPGTPIKPMLAKITNGIPELLKRFQGQPFTCEFKYDGQRAQIHMLLDGSIRIFTRDSGDATGRFPDVITIVQDAARDELKSFIIDAEVVAVNRENDNKLMAFQHLSTRERGSRDGSAVNVQNIKVDVCVFVFDIMFANNESLVKMPFQERRNCMHHWFPNTRPGYFGYASEITVEAEEDPVLVSQKVQGYLEEAFAASCEGLMAKALLEDSSYMASKRSDSWLKIKRDYVEGLQDSLDLVPIGAWHGNGRKAGWYSPFLLACYDPDREEYQSVCRVMSGFTDVFYKEMTEFYSGDHILPRKPPYYRTGEEPDIWFTAELVWEIRGADFTVSPVHQAAAGLVHPSRGISMRFPRFIRSRPDKKPDIASTPSDIADLFHKQTRKLEVTDSTTKVLTRPDSPH